MDTATFLYSDFRGEQDSEWARKFYRTFAYTLGNAVDTSLRDCRNAIEQHAALAKNAYEKRAIQPIAFATADYLSKQLMLLASSDCEESKLKYILQQICVAFFDVAATHEKQVHAAMVNEVLRHTRYQFLTAVWRKLIEYCFYEYKSYREICVYKSMSLNDWQNAFIDLYPRLILIDIAPIYERSFKDEIDLGDERFTVPPEQRGVPVVYIKGASEQSNIVLAPSPLYCKSFTPDEIAVHREEKKIIDETVANLSMVVNIIAVHGLKFLLDGLRLEVMNAEKEGYLQARQKIITEQVLRMMLPPFIAEEWKAELSRKFGKRK